MSGHEVSGWYALLVIALVISHTTAVYAGKWLQREQDRSVTRAINRSERIKRKNGRL